MVVGDHDAIFVFVFNSDPDAGPFIAALFSAIDFPAALLIVEFY